MNRENLTQFAMRVPFSVGTLKNYIKKGFPASKPGGKWIVNPKEAMVWLDSFRSTPEYPTQDDVNQMVKDVMEELC